MKTRHVIPPLYILFIFFADMVLFAQTSPVATLPNKPVVLAGSTLKTEDIVLQSDAIFIGKLIDLGWGETASSGHDTRGAYITVLQILRGSLKGRVGVRMNMLHGPKVREASPKVGDTYIFFIKQIPGWNMVLKILPATDANIAKVKALIAAPPAH
jgi:hypothetical protein